MTENNIIYSYTNKQAVVEGIFFDISSLNPAWATQSLFRFITTNLLATHGYLTASGEVNIPMSLTY
ncbi:MAG: hypothetical protein ACFFBD_28590 [Candidatus Hodarchaeota archaeon]